MPDGRTEEEEERNDVNLSALPLAAGYLRPLSVSNKGGLGIWIRLGYCAIELHYSDQYALLVMIVLWAVTAARGDTH